MCSSTHHRHVRVPCPAAWPKRARCSCPRPPARRPSTAPPPHAGIPSAPSSIPSPGRRISTSPRNLLIITPFTRARSSGPAAGSVPQQRRRIRRPGLCRPPAPPVRRHLRHGHVDYVALAQVDLRRAACALQHHESPRRPPSSSYVCPHQACAASALVAVVLHSGHVASGRPFTTTVSGDREVGFRAPGSCARWALARRPAPADLRAAHLQARRGCDTNSAPCSAP